MRNRSEINGHKKLNYFRSLIAKYLAIAIISDIVESFIKLNLIPEMKSKYIKTCL